MLRRWMERRFCKGFGSKKCAILTNLTILTIWKDNRDTSTGTRPRIDQKFYIVKSFVKFKQKRAKKNIKENAL